MAKAYIFGRPFIVFCSFAGNSPHCPPPMDVKTTDHLVRFVVIFCISWPYIGFLRRTNNQKVIASILAPATNQNYFIVFLIKSSNMEHFIRFSIEGYEFMARKRRYSEKRYKIC
jgi:hypothetical protein